MGAMREVGVVATVRGPVDTDVGAVTETVTSWSALLDAVELREAGGASGDAGGTDG